MKNFQVVETGKGIRKTYILTMTENEMTKYLRGLNEMNGYVEGLGGDRTYSAIAWTITKDGFGYIDLETIWSIWGKRVA